MGYAKTNHELLTCERSSIMDQREPNSEVENRVSTPEVAKQILDALADLKFGSLQIIVQDGVVVQMERTEKFRVRSTKGR